MWANARSTDGACAEDATRTACANGESVVCITNRFDVHRITVWTHTKQTAPKPLSPRPTVY